MNKYLKPLFASLLLSLFAGNALRAGNETAGNELPRFAVVSDIHFGSTGGDGAVVNVTRALKNLLVKEPLDALFVVGDLTQDGKPEQYDLLLSVFSDKSVVPEKLPVYYMMGNHDNFIGADAAELFVKKLQQPLHQFVTIKGYPFISLSQNGTKGNDYNDKTKKFLSDKLAYAARKYPGKPIFVFMHVPTLNTCYGSSENGWSGDALASVLNKYPQAIVFTGHSHMPVGDPRSIHQGKFTAVNDGSTTFTGAERGEVANNGKQDWGKTGNVTEGLIVNVLNSGNVQIERWDTNRDEEMLPRWTVEAPHDGSRFTYSNRNGLPAPVFAADAVPKVRVVRNDSCIVTFPQATDNEVVHHYIVEICDGSEVVQSFKKHSMFYLNSATPEKLTVDFSGLPVDKPLTARVTALDSYKNRSTPIQSAPFIGKGLPRFVVISDTHFENNTGEGAAVKVPKTLKNLLGKKPTPDAIFIVGDLTQRGKVEQYRQLLSVFNDKSNVPDGVEVFYIMGYQHDKSENNDQRNFLDVVKAPLHQYVEIRGYPFVYISEGGSRESPYNAEARRFLAEKMAEAAAKHPDKPIFVFMHVPPQNTCYGSWTHEGWGTSLFLPVLNQYPQAIVFSGHSHFPLGDPRSIHQDVFTAVNDGSVTYSEVEPKLLNAGIHPEGYENITEGVIVNLLENGNVEMERWDTYRNEEITPRWTVEAPHDGSRFTYKNRNGLPAPVFAPNTEVNITAINVKDSSCVVAFPQASDNEAVHHYLIEILDKDEIVAVNRAFSQFYLNSATPPSLSVKISGLPPKRKLTARVTALDSYKNTSAPVKSRKFQVK
jgi:3',5'-cyclic AMP phosphodiesterase CpdA